MTSALFTLPRGIVAFNKVFTRKFRGSNIRKNDQILLFPQKFGTIQRRNGNLAKKWHTMIYLLAGFI